jgi:serine/threonine-protein kinase RsbT
MRAVESIVPVAAASDIVAARQKARTVAAELGFEGADLTLIAAAISEVSRNIVQHATRGEIVIRPLKNGLKEGMCIVARDQGPGIEDLERAMQYGYSTAKGLGVGLPGAKWLMDEFHIESKIGVGTTVTMKKWRR